MRAFLQSALVHAVIAIVYVSFSYYIFVTKAQPDPIGTGLRMLFFTVVHIVATLVVMLGFVILSKAPNQGRRLVRNMGAVMIVAVLVFAVSPLLDNWMWILRDR